MQRKLLGLLFAAAAYGYYKFSKMTPEEKQDLKNRGSDLLKKFSGIKNHNGEKQPAIVSTENNY